jgi:hypothetical protein
MHPNELLSWQRGPPPATAPERSQNHFEAIDAAYERLRERERERQRAKQTYTDGLPDMTPDSIRQACVDQNGYETGELNEILVLSQRGFPKICNLHTFINLKALFLESNSLTQIENLYMLTKLRSLHLQQNRITKIEGLETLKQLMTLDLSQNQIYMIEGLSHLPKLQVAIPCSAHHFLFSLLIFSDVELVSEQNRVN